MISLTCDCHPGAPHDATIHHVREILSSGTHVSSSQKRKGLKSFLAESREKNWNYLFYPSAKSRRELKIKTLGVTFRGASAYYVQKSIAPQKKAVCQFSDENFFAENFYRKFSPIFFSTSRNELSGIVWNAFSQSLRPNGAILGPGVNGRSKFYKILAEIWCHHPGPRGSKLAKMPAYFL